MTLQALVQSLDGKDQGKDKEARGMQAGHEKGANSGRRGCDRGEATGAMGG